MIATAMAWYTAKVAVVESEAKATVGMDGAAYGMAVLVDLVGFVSLGLGLVFGGCLS